MLSEHARNFIASIKVAAPLSLESVGAENFRREFKRMKEYPNPFGKERTGSYSRHKAKSLIKKVKPFVARTSGRLKTFSRVAPTKFKVAAGLGATAAIGGVALSARKFGKSKQLSLGMIGNGIRKVGRGVRKVANVGAMAIDPVGYHLGKRSGRRAALRQAGASTERSFTLKHPIRSLAKVNHIVSTGGLGIGVAALGRGAGRRQVVQNGTDAFKARGGKLRKLKGFGLSLAATAMIPHASNSLKRRSVSDYVNMRFKKAIPAAKRIAGRTGRAITSPLGSKLGAAAGTVAIGHVARKVSKRHGDDKEDGQVKQVTGTLGGYAGIRGGQALVHARKSNLKTHFKHAMSDVVRPMKRDAKRYAEVFARNKNAQAGMQAARLKHLGKNTAHAMKTITRLNKGFGIAGGVVGAGLAARSAQLIHQHKPGQAKKEREKFEKGLSLSFDNYANSVMVLDATSRKG